MPIKAFFHLSNVDSTRDSFKSLQYELISIAKMMEMWKCICFYGQLNWINQQLWLFFRLEWQKYLFEGKIIHIQHFPQFQFANNCCYFQRENFARDCEFFFDECRNILTFLFQHFVNFFEWFFLHLNIFFM